MPCSICTQSASLPQACTQSFACGSQASPAGQVRTRATQAFSVASQAWAASPQSASEVQSLSESGTQALDCPQAPAAGKQRFCRHCRPLAQAPELHCETQNVPAAANCGCAAQA